MADQEELDFSQAAHGLVERVTGEKLASPLVQLTDKPDAEKPKRTEKSIAERPQKPAAVA